MLIDVLCATNRGRLVLERLFSLAPKEDFRVYSFKEDQGEPRYFGDIKRLTVDHGAAFMEARQLSSSHVYARWVRRPSDLMLVASWRYMIPRDVFSRVRLGTYVFHDSLLPRYRGFSPTVWGIANGEVTTGATLFEIEDEMDAGPIVAQKQMAIAPEDSIAKVMEGVNQLYLAILSETLPALMSGNPTRTVQDHALATYTCKRLECDNRIDWRRPTIEIFNLIRAVTKPYSGAFTLVHGTKLHVWSASHVTGGARYVGRIPGRVVAIDSDGVLVLTGDGLLKLREVQLENSAPAAANLVITSLKTTLGP